VPLRLAGGDFVAVVDLRAAALGAVGRDAAPEVALAVRGPRTPVAGARFAVVLVVFFLWGLLPVAMVTLSARNAGEIEQDPWKPRISDDGEHRW
jgi:hypothetical protein